MKWIVLFLVLQPCRVFLQGDMNQVYEKNMKVIWEYKDNRIYFEMTAPTSGWLAIGFNTTADMTGAYLIMGHLVHNRAEVVEHYTQSPGNYKPFSQLNTPSAVQDITGNEESNQTRLRFSLPIFAQNKYARPLTKGSEYTLTLAYSREDDFQHHSMMRTAIHVKL